MALWAKRRTATRTKAVLAPIALEGVSLGEVPREDLDRSASLLFTSLLAAMVQLDVSHVEARTGRPGEYRGVVGLLLSEVSTGAKQTAHLAIRRSFPELEWQIVLGIPGSTDGELVPLWTLWVGAGQTESGRQVVQITTGASSVSNDSLMGGSQHDRMRKLVAEAIAAPAADLTHLASVLEQAVRDAPEPDIVVSISNLVDDQPLSDSLRVAAAPEVALTHIREQSIMPIERDVGDTIVWRLGPAPTHLEGSVEAVADGDGTLLQFRCTDPRSVPPPTTWPAAIGTGLTSIAAWWQEVRTLVGPLSPMGAWASESDGG